MPSSAHACGEPQSGRQAVTLTVAPSRRRPTSGLSFSGRTCTCAKLVLTVAENGAVGGPPLAGEVPGPLTGGGTMADVDTVKNELRIKPKTVRFHLDDTDVVTP